ncbi:MAG TPA: ankyrin repeat domain-containing protein [Planctomycetaceae bacterium]|jgi:ankyrin repeat protein|nr:ankyrin repeat domain-containing protein [Planctomycetaceae bacterium]
MVDADLVHELHRAIKQADLGEVRRLVQLHSFQAEALINAIEEEYEVAALHTAAECGHVPTAMFLLDNGADVNIRDSGERSPLHRAAEAEDGVMIDFLILRGADTRLADYRGMRAFEFCYKHGYVAEVLRKESPAACFVQHGAKVNLDQAIRLGLT